MLVLHEPIYDVGNLKDEEVVLAPDFRAPGDPSNPGGRHDPNIPKGRSRAAVYLGPRSRVKNVVVRDERAWRPDLLEVAGLDLVGCHRATVEDVRFESLVGTGIVSGGADGVRIRKLRAGWIRRLLWIQALWWGRCRWWLCEDFAMWGSRGSQSQKRADPGDPLYFPAANMVAGNGWTDSWFRRMKVGPYCKGGGFKLVNPERVIVEDSFLPGFHVQGYSNQGSRQQGEVERPSAVLRRSTVAQEASARTNRYQSGVNGVGVNGIHIHSGVLGGFALLDSEVWGPKEPCGGHGVHLQKPHVAGLDSNGSHLVRGCEIAGWRGGRGNLPGVGLQPGTGINVQAGNEINEDVLDPGVNYLHHNDWNIYRGESGRHA